MSNTASDGEPQFFPAEFTVNGYFERTQRNEYWIAGRENQERLHDLCVGIAGVGCMGSGIAVQLVRAGVGHLKIADPDFVEVSNINRQVMATQSTVGLAKVDAVREMLARIAKDYKLESYREGIKPENVDRFLEGCDIVVDEIDVFEPQTRILLHRRARSKGIPIYASCAVGMGVRVYKFVGEDYTLEQFLETDHSDSVTSIEQLLKRLGAPLPSYLSGAGLKSYQDQIAADGAAAVFGPVAALGFSLLTTRLIIDFLNLTVGSPTPVMPRYIAFDAADLAVAVANSAESTATVW